MLNLCLLAAALKLSPADIFFGNVIWFDTQKKPLNETVLLST